jgi:hypothetical protein
MQRPRARARIHRDPRIHVVTTVPHVKKKVGTTILQRR